MSDAPNGLTIETYPGPLTRREGSQQANPGTFWGKVGPSDVEGYEAPILTEIECISADGLIDQGAGCSPTPSSSR